MPKRAVPVRMARRRGLTPRALMRQVNVETHTEVGATVLDWYIWGLAWFLLLTGGLHALMYPLVIGKPRGPYTAGHAVANSIGFTFITVPIIGRLLGIW